MTIVVDPDQTDAYSSRFTPGRKAAGCLGGGRSGGGVGRVGECSSVQIFQAVSTDFVIDQSDCSGHDMVN